MKLSQAIILGDRLKRPDPQYWLTRDGSCGCAIGGALLATGADPAEFYTQHNGLPELVAASPTVKERWPWITSEQLQAISDLYRLVPKGRASIEEVAAYVRSIEPSERPQSMPEITAEVLA